MKYAKHIFAGLISIISACVVYAQPASNKSQTRNESILADQNVKNISGFIIKYKQGTVAEQALGRSARGTNVATMGLRSIASISNNNGLTITTERKLGTKAHLVNIGRKITVNEALAITSEIAKNDSSIEYIQPDYSNNYPDLVTNDIDASKLWALNTPNFGINVNPAWEISTGKGVTVAVVDTGYRPHADLVANILLGYDFFSPTEMPTSTDGGDGDSRDADASDPGTYNHGNSIYYRPSNWHGTHVAGTIAAVGNNGTGVVGVAFNSKILPVRVLGSRGGYVSDISDGVIWAAGGEVPGVPLNPNPAKVINLSLGGYRSDGLCDAPYVDAFQIARSYGAVVVVSAGNNAMDAMYQSPANCPNVITVANTNQAGIKVGGSNFGSKVSVSAPGESIYSTIDSGVTVPAGDSYGYLSGTSMSAPHVSGIAALLFSKNPRLIPSQVEYAIINSTQPFNTSCVNCAGTGIVNAFAALALVPFPEIPSPLSYLPPIINLLLSD